MSKKKFWGHKPSKMRSQKAWDKCKTSKPKISRKNSNKEVPRTLLESPGSLLGPSWEPLGALLGPSWGLLSASWAPLGASTAPLWKNNQKTLFWGLIFKLKIDAKINKNRSQKTSCFELPFFLRISLLFKRFWGLKTMFVGPCFWTALKIAILWKSCSRLDGSMILKVSKDWK